MAPEDRKRPVEVGITDSERQRLSEVAQAKGLSLSAFIRSAALEAARQAQCA